MKKFKNSFGVKAPQSLLKAFCAELLLLGYKHRYEAGCKTRPETFSKKVNAVFLENDQFYGQSYSGDLYKYNLPADWDDALAAAAEEVEDVPEYVKVVDCGGIYPTHKSRFEIDGKKPSTSTAIDGSVFKVIKVTKEMNGQDVIVLTDDKVTYWADYTDKYKTNEYLLPATQAEYEAYQESLKPKLEVGKWYNVGGGMIIRYKESIKDKIHGHINHHYSEGVNRNGFWVENDHVNGVEFKPATELEVKTALITGAKKRGFGVGVRIKSAYNGNQSPVIQEEIWQYYAERPSWGLELDGWTVFNEKTGKWAEIITSYAPEIIVNGHNGQFTNDYVKFGCQTVTGTDIIQLNNAILGYNGANEREITSITIGADGRVSVKQLEEMANYFVNNKKK